MSSNFTQSSDNEDNNFVLFLFPLITSHSEWEIVVPCIQSPTYFVDVFIRSSLVCYPQHILYGMNDTRWGVLCIYEYSSSLYEIRAWFHYFRTVTDNSPLSTNQRWQFLWAYRLYLEFHFVDSAQFGCEFVSTRKMQKRNWQSKKDKKLSDN